jgi:hypothetical protein
VVVEAARLNNMKNDWIFEQYVKETYKNKLQPKDFYWENGKLVLTEFYHNKRGYCCGSKCRHCPFEPQHEKNATDKKSA